MKTVEPHAKSQSLRRFKPTRPLAGVFSMSVIFLDVALLALAFFLAVSPFVLQPGIRVRLPVSSFTGGAPFQSMVVAITPGGWYYFNDERLDEERLAGAFAAAAAEHRDAPLIIEADERVPHGAVVAAWNAALNAGIKDVSIATARLRASEARP